MRVSSSRTEREIADQPVAWERAMALAGDVDVLAPGARVAFIGCGSSWSAASAIAALRESRRLGEADAFAASEATLDRAYDRVVAISRSGTTSELLHALGRVRPNTPTAAIVGVPGSPIAAACDAVAPLDFADDQSVVQTRFVTSTIAFARASFGEDMQAAIADCRTALEEPLPDAAMCPHQVFLGLGWCAGLASAAALVVRETAQVSSEAYPAMEYRHGPIALAGSQTAVWMLGDEPAGLGAEIEATGAAVIRSSLDPLAQLVRVQRAAVALARARQLNADHPPHLTRSIVLETP
jgi:fructoselysine-6-P-deglycase FrlB-like protein